MTFAVCCASVFALDSKKGAFGNSRDGGCGKADAQAEGMRKCAKNGGKMGSALAGERGGEAGTAVWR